METKQINHRATSGGSAEAATSKGTGQHRNTEFPEERKGVIINLEAIAWHCNNLLCPYCMEKHASLVNGLSNEIADGNEGDQDTYRELADIYSSEIDRLQKNKQIHAFTQEDIDHYRNTARTWRRKLQGATETGHNHAKHEEEHEPLDEKDTYEHVLAECLESGKTKSECEHVLK